MTLARACGQLEAESVGRSGERAPEFPGLEPVRAALTERKDLLEIVLVHLSTYIAGPRTIYIRVERNVVFHLQQLATNYGNRSSMIEMAIQPGLLGSNSYS